MSERTVVVALFEGVQSLDVAGPMEVFAVADAYSRAGGRGPAYRIVQASADGATVRCSSGMGLAPQASLDEVGPVDTLVVPGGVGTLEPDGRLVEWLAANAAAARRVVSVCSGAFLLGEAGLLEGRRATTHWDLCASLARSFPGVRVESDPIFVRDGRVSTSAGVTAGIDLALALVEEDLGQDAALWAARVLVVYLRRPGGQAQFSAHLAARGADRPPLRELQHWIAENPGADLSVEALAARSGFSPRHFARVFAREAGMTPGRYVESVRLDEARRRLEETDEGVDAVARACGFGSAEAMRRAFTRRLGCSPGRYRMRFRTAA
ncbi:GlxA family transcriptional regulator [Nocardiopsis suaedae]|uniref:GlxA family transcriptional regulator n=1 Tax=Nocardiopsis suaedae TaxID=3018444 RepID=A0ABT4TRK0_9ACTN|nr:GlxA family transcriptional regulator [Nocardiopsis suaedae]MDA2806757.1 GlxA family transcriptional regulator [Nocardiopsis suaedae]